LSEISDLMQKDPLSLTKEDVVEIVAHYRANREKYVSGMKVPKAKAEKPAKGSVDLSNLEIDL
jgi:hypothetical protein